MTARRPYTLAWGIGVAILIWLLQLGLAVAQAGGGRLWHPLTLATLIIAVAAGAALPWRKTSWVRSGWLLGALAGATLGLVHSITMSDLAGPQWTPAGAAFIVLVSAALGFAMGWSRTLTTSPFAAIMTCVTALSGLILAHGLGCGFMAAPAVPAAALFISGGVFLVGVAVLSSLELGGTAFIFGEVSAAAKDDFRAIAEALPIPIMLTTADNETVLFANERSREQFLGRPEEKGDGAGVAGFYLEADEQRKMAEIVKREGAIANHMVEMRRADGSTFWALSSARAVDFRGDPAILAGFVDITERKVAEEALLASEVRYALISRAANDGIWDWDVESGKVYYSTRWKEIVGAESGKRLSTLDDWFVRVHPDDIQGLRRGIDEHIAGETPQLDVEYRIRHGDGRYCWMQCRGIALRRKDGAPIRMAGSQADVTLRKTYEINLRNAAYEDRLTGISNRAFFTHLADTRTNAESIRGTAIFLLNIDQFRRVNDSLGTGTGDALLIAFARRLATRLRPADALARLGGDEFAIWLNDVADHDTAMALTSGVLADLAQPFSIGDAQIPVTVSSGLAAADMAGATSGADLLHNARLALDRSKQMADGQCVLFDDQLLTETKLRQRLSRDLANAGRLGQIFFEYQPVVALSPTGANTVAGFEALMRWRHPELGLIPPAQFVPLAEEAGLIGSLGMLAIEHAAREIATWTAAGLTGESFSVAVNLSARQISDPSGVQRLFALLDRLTLPSGHLKLEITESVLMNDPETMAKTFRELRGRGIELSLDDFGTGYSSLSYLHRFPLNVLKVDRSFVMRMLDSPEALRLVRSIIELAHDLGLLVVAEGVESADEVECLRGLNCDFGQGYYFSRPVPAAQAETLLAQGAI